ncbi:hypothetical protein NBRC116583_36200 [Arenicella sp. 4NH20-0111]|uniref:S8 family serine peptidase n=1 Tax=Arenicella sp. 4NH20-0111 TaxID=3127648 RepID=UPI003107F6BE
MNTPIIIALYACAVIGNSAIAQSSPAKLNGTPSADAVNAALEANNHSRPKEASNVKVGRFLQAAISKQKTSQQVLESPFLTFKNDSRVQVYITLKDTSEQSLTHLKEHSLIIEIENSSLNKIQGWVDIDKISALSQLENVTRITAPTYSRAHAGRVTTQGDSILRANQLRNLGVTGKGVKVGIISDGASDWRTAANSGDLPNNITTYGSCTKRSADPQNCRSRLTCNEGTAMAEIIHDIAPDAELAVAAVSTSLEFIQQINRLANTFGADIIVDDLGFYGEPYFEDGDLARAVSSLPSNVLYFSSAGNAANIHYERQYSATSNSRHNFGSQSGGNDDAIGFSIGANRGAFVLLQWNDRYEQPNSNYDLFVFDQNSEIDNSTGSNTTAIEGTCIYNSSSTEAVRFAVIDKISGSDRRLEMFFLGANAIEYPTPAGSVFGHAGTRRALAVASINSDKSSVAFYSSRGPTRIDYPSFENRAKPDMAATDGVSVTGAGGFPTTFFGTSAAAPHAAAVAAQLLSASDDVTPQKVRSALLASASGGGGGSDVGSGRINAFAAFERLNVTISATDPSSPLSPEDKKKVITPILILLNDE